MSSQCDVYLRYVKLSEDALSPTRGSPKSAGFDLRNPRSAIITTRGKELILIDLQIELLPLTRSNGKFSNSYFSITLTDHNYDSSPPVFEMLYR